MVLDWEMIRDDMFIADRLRVHGLIDAQLQSQPGALMLIIGVLEKPRDDGRLTLAATASLSMGRLESQAWCD